MSPRVIFYAGWYSPTLCQLHPDKLFVFGDNLVRIGMGGQAIIRNEPNAVGVATKRKPSMAHGSFFSEGNGPDLDAVLRDLAVVWQHLKDGATVVFPVTDNRLISLGLERAELRSRAPSIYDTIVSHVFEMSNAYGAINAPTDEALV